MRSASDGWGGKAVVVALAWTAAVSGCGGSGSALRSTSSAPSSSGTVYGRVGPLEVTDAFVPEPASPSVAAVYLTVVNSGSEPDALLAVSSPEASTSLLMTEDEDGSVGTMRMLPELRVPAHGEASLAPGRDHVMLEHPRGALSLGRRLAVTLRFAKAGTVTIEVPVVPLDRMLDPEGSTTTTMPGGTS